jgi:hypothetical protein
MLTLYCTTFFFCCLQSFVNPEDVGGNASAVVLNDPEVERVRR